MEPLSRFLKERSAVEAPPIQASARVNPLRPTDTQHMCSLARALGEGGERNGTERQRSRREQEEEGREEGDADGGSRQEKEET